MEATITSRHNERLKELRKLHDRKHRDRSGLFLAEGEDLVSEALRWGVKPTALFYDPEQIDVASDPRLRQLQTQVELVPVQGDALQSAGSLGSGSRMIGVFGQESVARANREPRTWIYLHEVADPGNVGTVLRSALALVEGEVVLSHGTADPFGPKAVRASMGAIFGQGVSRGTWGDLKGRLAGNARLVAFVPGAGRPLREADLRPPVALCLGSERGGLPDEVAADCDEIVHVPLRIDAVESLNVAMTATLAMYEASQADQYSERAHG
jgi:RNA methyltransferase, TrmH family